MNAQEGEEQINIFVAQPPDVRRRENEVQKMTKVKMVKNMIMIDI